MKKLLASILVLPVATLMVAGCSGKKPGPTTAAAPDASAQEQRDRITAFASQSRRGNVAKGHRPDAPIRMRLDVYVLAVPYGTVSRNEEFWKRVNEQAVDVGTYDLLIKNGVRVGEAPIAEYERFAQIIKEQPASHRVASLVAVEGKDIDLELRKEVVSQTVWHLNGVSELIGRTFDRCENFVALSYQPAPRKRGTVRIVLCPVVKEHRKRLEWLAGNKEQEVAFTQPMRYYDVNLRADVSVNNFLIVAPSAESTWPGSIGNRFFVQDGAAEQLENILLFVPQQVAVME
ncbi:MAG: hypothetical protein M3478_13290 [Planctomycetota bacterium]|nr:hypothetical protein [Planctomycetota bacterium]